MQSVWRSRSGMATASTPAPSASVRTYFRRSAGAEHRLGRAPGSPRRSSLAERGHLGVVRRLVRRRLALEHHLQLEALVVDAPQALADLRRLGDRLGERALEIAQDLAQAAFANSRF